MLVTHFLHCSPDLALCQPDVISPCAQPSTWLDSGPHFYHLMNLTPCLSNMGVILGPLSYHLPQTFLNQTLQIIP